MQKLRKFTKYILKEMHQRKMDRQTDGRLNRANFIGPLPQKWRFFGNSRIKFLKLFSLIVSNMESYMERINIYIKKEHKQHSIQRVQKQ